MTSISPNASRKDFVDIAKGIAIIAVVFGHTWRGMNSANLIENKHLFWQFDSAIYAFHMPLFFLASAIFFKPAQNFSKGVLSRAFRLLLPLMLWSWILAVFKIAAGAASNSGAPSLMETLLFPFPPKAVFWFLLALFLAQVWADLIGFLSSKSQRAAATLASVALCVVFYQWPATPTWLSSALLHIPYFLIGTLLADQLKMPPSQKVQWVAFAAFAVCLGVGASLGASLETLPTLLVIALGLFGAIAILKGSALFSGTPVGQVLQFLGQSSFAIYVCHVIFTAATRIALAKLGVTSVGIQSITGTIVGIIIPVIMLLIARKLNVSRIVMLDPPNPKVLFR